MVHIDADLNNADWLKRTWDFPGVKTEKQLEELLNRLDMSMEAFKRLPAYQSAPWLGKSITKSLRNLAQGADWARERGLVPQSGNWDAPGRWILPSEVASPEDGQQGRLLPDEEFDDDSDPSGEKRLLQAARAADFSPDLAETRVLLEAISEAAGIDGLRYVEESEASALKNELITNIADRLSDQWQDKEELIREIAGETPMNEEGYEPEPPEEPMEPEIPYDMTITPTVSRYLQREIDELPTWDEDEEEEEPSEWYTEEQIEEWAVFRDDSDSYENDHADYEADYEEYLGASADWEEQHEKGEQLYNRGPVYDCVSTLIGLWAGTSGDTHPRAIAMQMMAKEEFSLEDSEDQHMKDALKTNKYGDRYDENPERAVITQVEKYGEVFKEFLRAQYENTQEFFTDNEIEAVTLFRGSSLKWNSVDWDDMGSNGVGITSLTHQPISSYSVNLSTAHRFSGKLRTSLLPMAEDEPRPDYPSIAVIRVPIADILSTCASGYGCLNEGEVTVLGHKRSGMMLDLDIVRDQVIRKITEEDEWDSENNVRIKVTSQTMAKIEGQVRDLQEGLAQGSKEKYVAPFVPEEESGPPVPKWGT